MPRYAVWEEIKRRVNNNVRFYTGAGTPTNGASGTGVTDAGPGSLYFDITNALVYMNTGTLASPVWSIVGGNLIGAQVLGTIAVADIIGTGAGQFGHAQGYPLVPAPGAGKALVLTEVVASYKFNTAGYTGGGNTTVNWGAGGAALTGLVSAANFAGAAADKPILFVPLSTVGIALVANVSLNLVAAAAFTQPGTAAGVINYAANYWTVTL